MDDHYARPTYRTNTGAPNGNGPTSGVLAHQLEQEEKLGSPRANGSSRGGALVPLAIADWDTGGPDLRARRSVAAAVRQHPLLVALTMLLFVLGGLGLGRSADKRFKAQTDFRLDVPTGLSQTQEEQLVRFYASEIISAPVLQRASVILGNNETVDSLASAMSVLILPGNVLGVQAVGVTSAEAIARAQATTSAALDDNRTKTAERFKSRIDYLNSELTRLAPAVAATVEKPNDALTAADVAVRDQYTQTYKNLQDLTLEQKRTQDGLTVLEVAHPTGVVARSTAPYVAAAVFLGVIVAILLALVRARFDDRIFGPEDMARAVGSPFVLNVPKAYRRKQGNARVAPFAVVLSAVLSKYPRAQLVVVCASSDKEPVGVTAGDFGHAAIWLSRPAQVMLADATSRASDDGLLKWDDEDLDAPAMAALAVRSSEDLREHLRHARKPRTGTEAGMLSIISVSSPLVDPAAVSVAVVADVGVVVATDGVTKHQEVARTTHALRETGLNLAGAVLLPKGLSSASTSGRFGRLRRWFRWRGR